MVDNSDLNELQNLVQLGADSAKFEYSKRRPKVGAAEFRQLYESSRTAQSPYLSIPPYWYVWAKTEMPQTVVSELTNCLERLLPRRSNRDGVHFLPAHRFGLVMTPSVEEIACRLVRGAALLDAGRSVALFHSWLEGEPLRYSHVLVLVGFKVTETLVVRQGVRLEPLPADSAQLLQFLPRPISERVWGDPGKEDLLGATAMVVDHEIEPVFPATSEIHIDYFPFDVASSSMPAKHWDSFLLALSLSCDVSVARTYSWATADLLTSILVGHDVSNSIAFGPSASRSSTYVATQADADQANSLLPKIPEHRDGLHVAITRWVKSKMGSVSDRLIDMRIVLESLYGVESGSGEFTFRVATTGAWHLGVDVDNRVNYHDAFYKLYRKASAVIHGRMVSDYDEELAKLLETCSSASRLGILKILDEGHPEWKRLRLGAQE